MPEIEYVWDELSDNVIEKYEDGLLSVSYDHEPGLYGNLLSQNRNGVTSYYHYDGRGDTVALTDDSGNVTDTKEYDVWGNVIASTGSTVTPYQFGGQQGYQTGNAGIYVRARMYQPIVARWLTKDPLQSAAEGYFFQSIDGQLSPYCFVRNQITRRVDPSGLRCSEAPLDDISFVSGRGLFSSIKLDTYWDESAIWWARWFSHLDLQFTPNGEFLNSLGCCCCEKIGIVQIVKQKFGYVDIWNPLLYPSHNWKVDDGICGVPYSANAVSAPCNRNPATGQTTIRGTLGFEDSPNAKFPIFAGYLTHFSQDFEACVVCISENSPNTKNEGLLSAGGKIYGAVSYGCVKWGHSWTIGGHDPRTWNWRRYLGDESWKGVTTMGGGTVPGEFSSGTKSIAPLPPSAEFKKAVLGWSITTPGCWHSSVYGI